MLVAEITREWERPEWIRPAPEAWETLLRQHSPIVDRTSHLRFRYRAAEDIWTLYECTPKQLLDPGRVHQLTQHWSELPTEQQHARKRFVTEYQHYMFRTHGVEARLFWVLQGNHGGTPACYTDRERKLLEMVGGSDDVPPIGMFPAAPFDQRAVSAIMARDRLLKYGNDLDALERSSHPDAQRREEELDDREYRRQFLSWWSESMAPMAEFLKSYLGTSEADNTLRRATRQEANAVTMWRDHFIETGDVIGAGAATSTAIQVAVH